MPSTQSVSFTSPGFDYGADISAIERRRKLAEALQAQAFEPTQTATANGLPTPISWTQGAAKLAQAWASARVQNKADERERELATKAQNDYKNMLAAGLGKLQGTPVSEDAAGNVTPAQAPDPMGALAAFGSHPMGAQFTPLAMSEISRQRLAESLRAGYKPLQANPMAPGPGASVMAGSGATVPQNAPQQAGVPGGPAGGQPMDFWLQIDPTGKLYGEQLAKDYTEAQKPVIDRGFGIKRFNPATGKYDLASNPADITTVEQAKLAATQPYEPPVTIKTSSGQDIQLSRPEYAEYQKTGQLPAKYGQQAPAQQPQSAEPLPASVPPEHAAAYRTVLDASRRGVTASAKVPDAPQAQGLGTPGLSQSQEDQIRQQGQLAANTEAGREFISEMRQNYAKLRDVPATLENLERAKTLAASEAAKFMGPFGESKLALTKFLRANVPGMGNLKTDSVTNAEELQSTLFNQVMDNLKKMDASPSQYQQQVMQEAFGTLRTDPQSVPKVLNVFSDILRNRVALHNDTVSSAEKRGTTFPYDVTVRLPKGGQSLDISPATREFMQRNGLKIPGE